MPRWRTDDLYAGLDDARFDADLKANRAIPDQLVQIIRDMPKGIHPMQALRTAVSYLGLTDKESEEVTPEARRAISIRLIAQFSTIIAAINRVQEGQDIVAPRADLTHAGNYLYMLNGKEPTPEQARLFEGGRGMADVGATSGHRELRMVSRDTRLRAADRAER